jgi:hypothetical protein
MPLTVPEKEGRTEGRWGLNGNISHYWQYLERQSAVGLTAYFLYIELFLRCSCAGLCLWCPVPSQCFPSSHTPVLSLKFVCKSLWLPPYAVLFVSHAECSPDTCRTLRLINETSRMFMFKFLPTVFLVLCAVFLLTLLNNFATILNLLRGDMYCTALGFSDFVSQCFCLFLPCYCVYVPVMITISL